MSFSADILSGWLAAVIFALGMGNIFVRLGFPLPDSAKRYGCIDGLRGMLALSVMVHHFRRWTLVTTTGLSWETIPASPFDNLGQGAVALFFMVTGFVFYPRIRDGWRSVDWPKTYILRVFRIVPAVVLSVVLVSLVIVACGLAQSASLRDLKAALIWVTAWNEPGLFGDEKARYVNATVLWSLRIEWLFYLLLLPTLSILRELTKRHVPSVAVPLVLMIGSAVAQATTIHFAYWTRFGVVFGCGMLAWEISQHEGIRLALQKRIFSVTCLLAMAVATSQFNTPYAFPQITAYFLLFICVSSGNSMFGILSSKGAIVLGEISFSIYILHAIVLYCLFNIPAGVHLMGAIPLIGGLVIAAICVVTTAGASFLLVEKPFIDLGYRASGGSKKPPRPSETLVAEVAP